MALFGKKSDASASSTGSPSTGGTATASPDAKSKGAKGAKGGKFGKKKGADAAPATAPVAPAGTDSGVSFDDFSDFGSFGAPAPEIARAPVSTTRARPKVLGGTAIGLNIGNATIKVVELRSSGGSIKVTGAGMVPTPAESLSNGVIISQGALAQAVRDAIQAAGIKSKAVTTAVSGTGSIVVRVVDLPRMSDKELEETMKTDAEKFIPFAPEEVRLDFRALRELPTPPDSPNMDVLIAAAQREVLYQYGDTLKAARLSPRAIEVEPLAAARAISHAAEGSEVDYTRVSAIVNIGATATEISVLRGDILVFTRTLPSGGQSLTQALIDYLGLAQPDAERAKQDMADALPSFQAAGPDTAAQGTGFDSFGGDDWSNMDFDASASTSTSTSGALDTDPFGVTLQKDAPEQHAQKQDGDKDDAEAFDFSSFDFSDLPDTTPADKPVAPATSAAPAVPPTAAEAGALGGFSFDFDAPEEPAEESAPPAPAVVTPQDPHQTPSGVSSTVISFAKPDAGAVEAAEATQVTGASTSPASPASTYSEPTPAPSGSAPGSAPGGFSFDFDAPDEPAAETPAVAAMAAATSPVAPIAPGQAAASSFDFDFPSGANETSVAPQAAEVAPVAPMAPVTEQFVAGPTSGLVSGASNPLSDPSVTIVPADDSSAWGLDDLTADTTPAPVALGKAPSVTDAGVSGVPVVPASDADAFDLDALFSSPVTDAGIAGGSAAMGAGGFGSAATDDPFGTTSFGPTGFDTDDFGAGNDPAPGVDASTVYSILHPLLDELAGEIRRSLEYHASRYPEAVVQSIELIGGGAKLRNLDTFLTQSLGIPASVADPVRNLGTDLPPAIRADAPAYGVAVGLALRELLD